MLVSYPCCSVITAANMLLRMSLRSLLLLEKGARRRCRRIGGGSWVRVGGYGGQRGRGLGGRGSLSRRCKKVRGILSYEVLALACDLEAVETNVYLYFSNASSMTPKAIRACFCTLLKASVSASSARNFVIRSLILLHRSGSVISPGGSRGSVYGEDASGRAFGRVGSGIAVNGW